MKHKLISSITITATLVCTALIACASNNMGNLNESPDTKITLVETYKTKELQEFIDKENICKTGKNIDACTENKKNLADQFNFNVDQIGKNNPISRINAYSVTYPSHGVSGEARTLSGAILVPDVAKDKIKGVILFYHPRDVTKYYVPSCFMGAKNLPDYCLIGGKNHGSNYAMQIGGVFTSQGYVVIMPDYIGQGIDSSIMHPYMIYPQANARSGLDMLSASRQLLKTLGIEDTTELNLYLSGYSEGGAYSLWASRLLQGYAKNRLSNNNYSLGLTVPISGAYDLSGAQTPFLFANVRPYPHADKYKALAAEELTSMKPISATTYLTTLAYYNFNQDYSNVLNPDFLSCGSYCKFGGNTYTIPELYTLISPDLTKDNIFAANKNAALDTINQDNNLAYGSENNSIRSLVADGITKNQIFNKVTKQADIVSWKTTKPVTFVHLDYDSVIAPLNTQNAYNGLRRASNKNLVDNVSISNFDYNTSITSSNPNVVKPIDNVGCRVFSYIAALNEFNKAVLQD